MTERVIHLIRHATTKLNNDDIAIDRFRGWTNHPLSKEGRDQAFELAKIIARHPPDVLLCSDLNRAVDTAWVIAQRLGMKDVHASPAFRPWHVGDFAGTVVQEAMPTLIKHVTDWPEVPLPGGESFNTFRKRFFTGLAKACEEHDGEIGIVTHHRCERLMKGWAKAGFPKDGSIDTNEFRQRGAPTGYCGIVIIPADRLPMPGAGYMPRFGDGQEERWMEWVSD